DGAWAICRRADTGAGTHKLDRSGADFWLYRLDGQTTDSPPWEAEPDTPCANETMRNQVYRFLLQQLTLSVEHNEALRQRGFTLETIHANGYRSLPLKGRGALARAVREQFGESVTRTIPGLYVQTDGNRSWWTLAGPPALLIPVRNPDGQIIALKLRADDDAAQSRYSTLSSRSHGGPGPGAHIHVPLHDGLATQTIRITEGELKADVAQQWTGILTLALPGVSSWRPVVPILRAFGAQTVLIAFDADWRTNPHVESALGRTAKTLTDEGFHVQLETWPPAWGKGIDDVLTSGHEPEQEAFSHIADETHEESRSVLDHLAAQTTDPEQMIRIALEHPETQGALALIAKTDPAQWERWLLHLKDEGAHAESVSALKRTVRALRREQSGFHVTRPNERPPSPHVHDAVPTAPVQPETVIPSGWSVDLSGVYEEKLRLNPETGVTEVTRIRIAPVPLVISGRLRDVADGTESVRLEWPRDGHWIHTTVRRAVVASARSLVELADRGLPVTTNTASAVSQYLADFEAANLTTIPRAQVSAALGWQPLEQGQSGFLWGHTLLRPQTAPVTLGDLDGVAPDQWDNRAIAFHGADSGDEQAAAAFHAAGTWTTWKAAVTSVAEYPRAVFSIYAALSAPFLALLGAPNFIVDWSFTTSTGKTSALRIAASCWGNPDEREPSSVLGTWDVTRTWIERMSGLLNGLPLILDDTKRARSAKLVGQTLYDIASGRGRGRGTPRGMQRAGSWATVLLSTGESPAVQFTQDGGTRARTITLWGAPFGQPTKDTGQIVTQVDNALRQHYGHAGPRLVQWLLDHTNDWEAWRVLFRDIQTVYQQKAGDNAVAARFAAYFAALDVVAQIAHQALELPWDPAPILDAAWTAAIEESTEADRAAQALVTVVTWAELNSTSFWGRHYENFDVVHTPPGGWAGKWEQSEHWDLLGISPQRIQEILLKAGWDAPDVDGLLRTWRDRDWIEPDSDRKRYTKKMRVGNESPRLVAIKREAIDALT
ncbi:MAG: DUF927 domain-containing protein, partial [Sulfobacillus sp.]